MALKNHHSPEEERWLVNNGIKMEKGTKKDSEEKLQFIFITYIKSKISNWPRFSRYYELGPDDPPYDAKFYDCCGAEDPNAEGCAVDFHVSYDDE